MRLLDAPSSEPINLGNPEEMSSLDLPGLVMDLVDFDSKFEYEPLPADNPRVRRPDISRARELLRWEPKVGIKEGLRSTMNYLWDRLNSLNPPSAM